MEAVQAPESPIITAALQYARLGWYVVPVRGKVPSGGAGWPQQATKCPGEAACLFDDTPHDGVGVLLGPRSNLIDLDCDSDQAEATLQELFAGQVPETPTYRSAKGLHRLFRWCERLPANELTKAKFVVDGLEVRIGGGDRAAQTVFPPSAGRKWIIGPETPVAELPAAVVEGIAARLLKAKPSTLPAVEYTPPPAEPQADDQLDVSRWLARHNVPILGVDQGQDGARRWFIRCPNLEAHTTKNAIKDCVITQEGDGRLGGQCFHASCGMSDWAALKAAIGPPDYQDYNHAQAPVLEEACAAIMEAASQPADEDEDSEPLPEATEFPQRFLSPGGLLGAIIDYTLATAMYRQPELALAAAIALLATVTGRKVTDVYGTRTNLYVLALAKSGVGKEHPRQVNKHLLLHAGGEKMLGNERVGSHAGIVNAVFENPALLMQLDEMGRLLATMKNPERSPHLYSCITVLMQLYSSANSIWKADAYADSKKVRTIDQPHLVIFGTSTPEAFWGNLSTENIAEGMVGRLIAFEGRGYDQTTQMHVPEKADASVIVAALRNWVEFRPGSGNLSSQHPVPYAVPHTEEARARYLKHVEGINTRRPRESDLRAALWSRAGEKTNKLALIHACSRSIGLPSEISLEDVEFGIALTNWLTRRLLAAAITSVSENETEARAKRVLALLGIDGLTSSQLTRKTQWLRGRERQEILKDLAAANQIEHVQVETKGRSKMIIRPKLLSKKAMKEA